MSTDNLLWRLLAKYFTVELNRDRKLVEFMHLFKQKLLYIPNCTRIKPVFRGLILLGQNKAVKIVSVLGQDKGYTVKNTPSPEGVPEGEARENS